jgi:hypothetical protein
VALKPAKIKVGEEEKIVKKAPVKKSDKDTSKDLNE